jgi:hypothetical protein
MPDGITDACKARLIAALSPMAEQAARTLSHLSRYPQALGETDSVLAGRIGNVSAQHVALVRRELISCGLVTGSPHSLVRVASELVEVSANLSGVSIYLRQHRDRDEVRLAITEPGDNSALRQEINRVHALRPVLFQTTDAFLSLALEAQSQLAVLVPFIDDHGADFLLSLFSNCRPEVRRTLICRPLAEAHCGPALRKRRADVLLQGLEIYEYALPSSLPSRRETFHAKVLVADETSYYVGSSNFMGSALERSLECGVVVHGESARELAAVVGAIKRIAKRVTL